MPHIARIDSSASDALRREHRASPRARGTRVPYTACCGQFVAEAVDHHLDIAPELGHRQPLVREPKGVFLKSHAPFSATCDFQNGVGPITGWLFGGNENASRTFGNEFGNTSDPGRNTWQPLREALTDDV